MTTRTGYVPFEQMTADQHEEAANRCDEIAKEAERAGIVTSLRYRMETSAIEHRKAAEKLRPTLPPTHKDDGR